jgi:hypothetical protein
MCSLVTEEILGERPARQNGGEGGEGGGRMPTIEIKTNDMLERHLAALRLMSFMVFPDNPELRKASEITFRTKVAARYAQVLANQRKETQIRFVNESQPQSREELRTALADPASWLREVLLNVLLKPLGGVIGGALALTDSPSAQEFVEEFRRRWFAIHYTGTLIWLIGSINEQRPGAGASLNKALHVLSETDGKNTALTATLKEYGYPAVNDSSLKAAWRVFRPVAHLCAAYVATETLRSRDHISRGFTEYWSLSSPLHDDVVFYIFCNIAKSAESFVTSFRSHGHQNALIPREEICALPDKMSDQSVPSLRWMKLRDEEVSALRTYRAPI